MNILTSIEEWRFARESFAAHSVGFIATMGNLHAGHLSLCQRSQQQNTVTVVSIFVNPTQFNDPRDFNLYPRTLDHDSNLLAKCGVDYLFVPTVEMLYPDGYKIQIKESLFAMELEGAWRPGHFNGMLTIVLKLLNIIQPNRAYFGEKDYQQYLLIKKMAEALFLTTEIISCETIRDYDGMAFSSRNSRLTKNQRIKAANFPALLKSKITCKEITEKLMSLGFKIDYIAEQWNRRLGAVWIDDIRLIDNFSME